MTANHSGFTNFGAPDWTRTSGLPGRSRTLYPSWATDAHVWKPIMQDGIQLFNFSRQTVVRLLLSQNWTHDKTACLQALRCWNENISQLSEPNALSNWATDAHLWKPSEDGFQLFSYRWSNSSQTTTKPKNAMPKNGFVMRFFSCARWGVGVVGELRQGCIDQR